MILLVCGGRDFDNWAMLEAELSDYAHYGTLLVTGGASGADAMAAEMWNDYQLPYVTVPAMWGEFGKSAGWARNLNMADGSWLPVSKYSPVPDLVIAFPGGKGTASMVKIARERSIEVIECE